jgi:hypothetical protein
VRTSFVSVHSSFLNVRPRKLADARRRGPATLRYSPSALLLRALARHVCHAAPVLHSYSFVTADIARARSRPAIPLMYCKRDVRNFVLRTQSETSTYFDTQGK